MIVRIWHGWTTPENAESYQTLLEGTIAPGIMAREIPGILGLDVLRRELEDHQETEFITVMIFEDWTAVHAFAGPEPAKSVVPPRARELLSRFDDHSQHYEMAASFPLV